MKVIPEMPHVQ